MQTDTRTPSNGGSRCALPTGSLLSWGPRDGEKWSLRGYLSAHPETTLFIIEENPFDDSVRLMGAIIPDDEEQESWELSNAKAAAEAYLREWLTKVAAPLFQ